MSESVNVMIIGGSRHLEAITINDDRKKWDLPKYESNGIYPFFKSEDTIMSQRVSREQYRREAMLIVVRDEKVDLIIEGRAHPSILFLLRRECLVFDRLSDNQAEDLFFSTFYGPGF